MSTGKVSFALIVCLLLAGPGWADEPVVWLDLHCEPLVGTLAGFTVSAALDAVGRDPESPYYQNYQLGNYADCVDTLLAILSEGEQLVRELGADREPRQADLLLYSGHPWSFWFKVERLGRSAEAAGLSGALTPEFRVVLRDLNAAFMPLLDPMVVIGSSLEPETRKP